MYDIRQFRPTLYLLISVGVTGFCLAARSPGLWMMGMLTIWAHLHLKRGNPVPGWHLPSWAAAVAAMIFGLVTVRQFVSDPGSQLLVAGRFLVLLQLVKLYQEGSGRGDHRVENRNYTWLLVLSLLLMVAASISTASLLFGLILIAYLFLSLYCCLLFHLKAETENAKAAMTLPKDVVNPAVLRQDIQLLPSSMRRLTVAVSFAGLACAVVVFLFFPRGPGQGLFGQLNFRPNQALTGFSETVSFESVARITQSQEVVADVEVRRDGELVNGGMTLYLRGVTLDTYSGNASERGDDQAEADDRSRAPWQWTRARSQEQVTRSPTPNEREELASGRGPVISANFNLRPTGVSVIFAPPGVFAVSFQRDARFLFYPGDETIRLSDVLNGRIGYTVYSRNEIGYRPMPGGAAAGGRAVTVIRSKIDPKIVEFAKRPEVSGVDENGRPLWERRLLATSATGREQFMPQPHAVDVQIARNIEKYLKDNFSYTLDLTDTTRRPNEDPIVKFLEETKRGHCEYFAGAMTLLCQALRIDARMVTGFKCDDFNTMMGRYIVKQSDAHAWVEVRVGAGEQWEQFDPTTGREAVAARVQTLWGRINRLAQFLEYSWADTVVAYDRERRDSLMSSVERGLTAGATRTQQSLASWDRIWPQPSAWWVDPRLVAGTIVLIMGVGVGAIGYFAWERYRLFKRAARIGLKDLPDSDQLRLARQLGFYDEMIRMLAARGYVRAPHYTPLEFSESLTHLPAEAYDSVHRITRIYYRIRYGRARLGAEYIRRVRGVLTRLEPALGPVKVKAKGK